MPDSMPAGTVLPYAGPLNTTTLQQALLAEGWMLCDGTLLSAADYPDLYAVIGMANGGQRGIGPQPDQFNLPDLRSRFVRGVNDNALLPGGGFVDPDVGTRVPGNRGGNAGNAVGSFEGYATGLPSRRDFMGLSMAGAHVHGFSHTTDSNHNQWKGSNVLFSKPGAAQARTESVAAHQHLVSGGGDAETRPTNLALNWVIKCLNAT
jgi:hypothetical protein